MPDPQSHPLASALETALANALRPGTMTQPMQVQELAGYFDVERHAMTRLLKRIPGAQRNGRRGLIRIPVAEMPPSYLADVALRTVASLEQFGARRRLRREKPTPRP